MKPLGAILALVVLLSASPVFAQLEKVLPAAEAPAEAAASDAPLPLRSPDAAIEGRLRQLYREVDGLSGVQPRVRGGVVTLTGSVLTSADARRAGEVAQRVEGVVSVESQLTTEHRLTYRLQPLAQRAFDIAERTVSYLPLLLVAALAFMVFWWAGRRVTRSTRLFKRLAPNPFVEGLIEQLVRLVFIVLGLVVALNILGATALMGSILGAAGLIGLAVGFAVRDTIENYLAGVMLSIRQPFAPNDHVLIEGFDGQITRLTSRVTVITTFDGNEVQIPNATVYKANLTNFSRTPDRRFDFEVPLDPTVDVTCALATALGAAKGVEGVLAEPAASVVIDRVVDAVLIMKVFGWVDQTRSDFGRVKSETVRQVKQALEAAHIGFAAPIRNIRYLGRAEARTEARAEPAAADLRAIEDTRVDETLRDKVKAIRKECEEEDLLDPPPDEPQPVR